MRGEGPAKPEAEGAMAVDLWGLEARHAEDGVLEGTEAEGAALDEFDRIGPEPHLFQGRRGRKKWGGASTIRWGRGGGPRAKGVPRVAVCASCALARRTTCRGRTRGPGEGERQGEREVESEVVWGKVRARARGRRCAARRLDERRARRVDQHGVSARDGGVGDDDVGLGT